MNRLGIMSGWKGAAWILALAVFLVPALVLAYEIPRQNTNAEYLYVFGTEGNPYLGADDVDHQQVVFINVPENASGDVLIKVYDPDTSGFRDLKPMPESAWDTTVEFSVYGDAREPLASKTFGESTEYDKKWYTFGPFKKEDGKKVGNAYQFKLVANALEGEDQNLFKVAIYPDSAESFSDKISFRLLPNEGDRMNFYVGIPAGVTNIIVENYDLDPDGGSATMEDPMTRETFKIAESESAHWAQTPVTLQASEQPRRLAYAIIKKSQHYANAAVRVKDDKGNVLPLYYSAGRPVPVVRHVVPPAVKKVPDIKCNRFTFDATSSYDPNKEKISYLWDFGDGTSSTEPVVTHVYEKGGEYTTTLTVKDPSGLECDTATTTQKVRVNTPPVADFMAPEEACVGTEVMLDASATADDTPQALTYMWDFGDGTKGEGKTVAKTYEKGGNYKVHLNVNDNAGTACSAGMLTKIISINSAPMANAGEDIERCFAIGQELRVAFDGGKSHDPDGDALTYDWNFGDGETASGKTVAHVYSKPGNYTTALTVSDGRDSACSISKDMLMVKLNRTPIANAGEDITACAGAAVTLDGSKSEGDNLKYMWSFGDGETGEGVRASHSYAKGGHYKAVLTVDDQNNTPCSMSSSSANMYINEGPMVSLENVESACLGTAVKFTANAKDPDGDALVYAWDFGDGTEVKGGASQSHEYAKGGVYAVRVTVDDKRDTSCSLMSAASKVRINSRPIANAGPNLVCCIDKETVFDGSDSSDPDGDALMYHWNFGDGAEAEGAKVTHAYAKSGHYKVTLTVDDGSGTPCSSDSSSFEAVVNERPVSVIKIK